MRLQNLIGTLLFLYAGHWNSATNLTADELEDQAHSVLEKSCAHCHAKHEELHGSMEKLEITYLVQSKYVDLAQPRESEILRRMRDTVDPMPPADASKEFAGSVVNPSPEEISIVEQWLFAYAERQKHPHVESPSDMDLESASSRIWDEDAVHKLVNSFLLQKTEEERQYYRFFSFANVVTLKQTNSALAQRLEGTPEGLLYFAISKAINSLNWAPDIINLEDIEDEGVVFAFKLNRLRSRDGSSWDKRQWKRIVQRYPYALKLRQNKFFDDTVVMTDDKVPVLRGDWFLANGLRPPLYHDLLDLPETIEELEKYLGVNAEKNIVTGDALRVGFLNSGISKNANRLAERHQARFGYYWKSYDFLPGAAFGNILQTPTGPKFQANPFNDTAFEHDGGEMLFSLPNGLQAYFLANNTGARLSSAPPELVNDDTRVSGNALIVNGISCISCHTRGIYSLPKDEILSHSQFAGEKLSFLQRLHRQADVDSFIETDRLRFSDAIKRTMHPKQPLDVTEPIGLLVKHYNNSKLELVDVAAELGMDAQTLHAKITNDPDLREMGLSPLLQDGGNILRDDWEKTSEGISKFQNAAHRLKIGTPLFLLN